MNDFLDISLFTISKVSIQINDIIALIIFIVFLKVISKIFKTLIFKYSKRDKGSSFAVYNLFKYLLWVVGF